MISKPTNKFSPEVQSTERDLLEFERRLQQRVQGEIRREVELERLDAARLQSTFGERPARLE